MTILRGLTFHENIRQLYWRSKPQFPITKECRARLLLELLWKFLLQNNARLSLAWSYLALYRIKLHGMISLGVGVYSKEAKGRISLRIVPHITMATILA